MSSAIQYSQVSRGAAMLGLGVAVGAAMTIDAYLSDAHAGPRHAQKYTNHHQATQQVDWFGAIFGNSATYQAPAKRTVVGRGAVHDSGTQAVYLTSRYVRLPEWKNAVYDTRRHIIIEFDDRSVMQTPKGGYANRFADTTSNNLRPGFVSHLTPDQAGGTTRRIFMSRQRGIGCTSVLGYHRMTGPSPFSGGGVSATSSSGQGGGGTSGGNSTAN